MILIHFIRLIMTELYMDLYKSIMLCGLDLRYFIFPLQWKITLK